eukprot:scaffold280453_cov31-Tisochrysis_lutea.AAC.2
MSVTHPNLHLLPSFLLGICYWEALLPGARVLLHCQLMSNGSPPLARLVAWHSPAAAPHMAPSASWHGYALLQGPREAPPRAVSAASACARSSRASSRNRSRSLTETSSIRRASSAWPFQLGPPPRSASLARNSQIVASASLFASSAAARTSRSSERSVSAAARAVLSSTVAAFARNSAVERAASAAFARFSRSALRDLSISRSLRAPARLSVLETSAASALSARTPAAAAFAFKLLASRRAWSASACAAMAFDLVAVSSSPDAASAFWAASSASLRVASSASSAPHLSHLGGRVGFPVHPQLCLESLQTEQHDFWQWQSAIGT